ncbi:sodium:solute symporter family protein [Desulfofundulus thermocisternus]|uniref:sodium:solute symporter family protein n=1 Tax=Desulfofundulus thermocisternus TaxID=42471 RepID=UPI0019F6DA66|nr:sodium:solute symporter family protein [Desulfofundulus thermocisternus]MBE3586164.1 sodium:solute symporter family protein [Thermoanaerobacter sp.]MCS5697137.1 sodium:solute symporter family protein [Desulfofundulus thermocisternus]
MNSYGYWILGLAVLYTAVLIILGNIVRRRATSAEGFWVGGRSFRPWMVFACITGLFSGSTFIAVMELAYLKGVSAAWYGVAEMVHVLIIAIVLLGMFRRKLVITISGLIGDHFGRFALGVAGLITALTFPMWSVATALSFASAVSAFTNLPITVSVIISALLLLIYLQAGGMWSVVMTQTANTIMFALMFIIGAVAFFIKPGIGGLTQLAASRPEMFDPAGVGLQVIIAWFATFLINVLLAQAALQMALSCRTVEEGRRGLLMAVGANIFFIFFGVLFGLAAAAVVPGGARGMIQVPLYLAQVLPAPLVGVFFLGVWACALGWGAPCQFSGSTSLGRDFMGAVNPGLTDEQKVRYTRISLVLLTGVMILLSFLRSDQAAWWNVLAWTLRNGATFAPVVAALFWPLATRRAAVTAMLCGFLSGLAWYYLGGWHPNNFYLNIHPVFVGMSANILGMVLVTLVEQAGKWRVGGPNLTAVRRSLALFSGTATAAVLLLILTNFGWLHKMGLFGLSFFLVVVGLYVLILSVVVPKEEMAADMETDPATA